jgi:hypothetical protein
MGLLANGVQPEPLGHIPQPLIVRPARQRCPQPIRLIAIDRLSPRGGDTILDDLQRNRAIGAFVQKFNGFQGHEECFLV